MQGAGDEYNAPETPLQKQVHQEVLSHPQVGLLVSLRVV